MTGGISQHAGEDAVWAAIRDFPLDHDGDALPFTRRLAEENGWSVGYAVRAVHEYRRFVYLAMMAGHPVTPSDEVDQVWHLHLLYTRSYWDEFCGRVLGRPLHHHPTRGGRDESAKFADQYERTLESYRAVFGEPPSDIWPPAKARFGKESKGMRIAMGRYWLVPRPLTLGRRLLQRWNVMGVAFVGLLTATSSAQAAIDIQDTVLDLKGEPFLRFYSTLLIATVLVCLAARWMFKRIGVPAGDDAPVDAYEAAYLAGGPRRVVSAAITRLYQLEAIRPVGKWFRIGTAPSDLHPVERMIIDTIRIEGKRSDIRQAAKSATSDLAWVLAEQGLILPWFSRVLAFGFPLAAMGGVLVLGGAKVVVGLDRDRPVGYLLGLLLVGVVVMVFLLRRTWITSRGSAVLKRVRQERQPIRRAGVSRGVTHADDAAWVCGLYGLAALGDPFASMRQAARPIERGLDGSGSGMSAGGGCVGGGCSAGGCSGGGGGGGCGGGGCGGCGGG